MLRINFKEKLEEKNNSDELSNELSTTDNEIKNVLEPENVEVNIFECMKITEPYREIETELTLKLEELKINNTNKSPKKPNSFSVSSKLPKTELPLFSGDPLRW